MATNNPSPLCAFDRIRMLAMQRWCHTIERTAPLDLDILELACGEASRRYQDLEHRTPCVIARSFEDMSEIIDAWVIWQALRLQLTRPEHCPIGASGIRNFTRELEYILERLTNDVTYDLFLL